MGWPRTEQRGQDRFDKIRNNHEALAHLADCVSFVNEAAHTIHFAAISAY